MLAMLPVYTRDLIDFFIFHPHIFIREKLRLLVFFRLSYTRLNKQQIIKWQQDTVEQYAITKLFST